MYTYLLILGISLLSFSATPEIKKIYSSYKKDKSTFFSADHSKTKTPALLQAYLKQSEAFLDKIKMHERKSKKVVLSEEGNQIALDLELVEPIQILVTAKFDKTSCTEAKAIHSLNYLEKTDDYQSLTDIINKLCD